jgi:flagellar protein FliO/FliZ
MILASIPRALAVLCTAFLVAPAAALAADGEKTPLNLGTPEKTAEVAAGPGSGGLVRTIVGLAVVIGVIYGLYWILKQVKSSREDRAAGDGLRSLATLPLGPNRALHLIRAGGEVVLVGVGEGGVTPIRTYTEEEALELGLIGEDDDLDDDPPRAGAVRWLDRLRDRTVRR